MKIGCVDKWGGRAFQMQLSAKQNSRTMQMMTMTIVIMMWPDIHHTIQSTHRTFTTIDIHYTRLFILCNIRCPPMMIDKSIICFIYFFGLVFGVAGLWTILHMVVWMLYNHKFQVQIKSLKGLIFFLHTILEYKSLLCFNITHLSSCFTYRGFFTLGLP